MQIIYSKFLLSMAFFLSDCLSPTFANVYSPIFPGVREGNCNSMMSMAFPADPAENLTHLCYDGSENKQCSELPAACFDCDFVTVSSKTRKFLEE